MPPAPDQVDFPNSAKLARHWVGPLWEIHVECDALAGLDAHASLAREGGLWQGKVNAVMGFHGGALYL
jgi:hypothetical protein